jgi:AcrR family transcriptional regulator
MSDSSVSNINGKEKIMQAALPLFAAKGLEGTTTREIAQASGLNVSLISYYFGGKEGLYDAIIQSFATRTKNEVALLTQDIDLNKVDQAMIETFVFRVIEKMVNRNLYERDFMTLIHREVASGMPHTKDIHEKLMSEAGDALIRVFEAGQSRGVLRADLDLRAFFLHLVHTVDGYMMAARCRVPWTKSLFGFPEDKARFCKHLTDLFLRGSLT